jgi:lysophospholipid acyltransferase (LPLAT)-like uncharacterized protein
VSKRRLSRARRAVYAVLTPLLAGLVRLLWRSCRVDRVIGAEHGDAVLASGRACVPCLWHEHLAFSLWYLSSLRDRGLSGALLISPSVDGELFTQVAQRFGARVVRGSATRTGAKAFRSLLEVLVKEGVSPVTTPDGPHGPRRRFKKGAVMLASKSGAPLLPVAFAARPGWRLPTWDRLLLPLPFSRVVVAVGAPRAVPGDVRADALQRELELAAQALDACSEAAEAALAAGRTRKA